MTKYILTLLLVLTTSCSSKFVEPEVNLVDLQFLETTLFETNLQTKVRILNPNNEDLTITGSRHFLRINDMDLGTALSNRRVTVPALGDATELLTVRISNLKVFTKLEKLINSRNFDYEIKSTFYTTRGLGFGTVNATTNGRMENLFQAKTIAPTRKIP